MYLAKEHDGLQEIIEFNETYALSRIMARINALKHPAESEIRKKRVNEIKSYFKTRRLGEVAADLMRRNGYVIEK
jgi:hypothetical protein